MHRFRAELWPWHEEGSWVFLTVPADVSDAIADGVLPAPRGFGSVRVEVTVGGSTWRTSLFPSKQHGAYLLPVKKQVRQREGVDVGDAVDVRLEVLQP